MSADPDFLTPDARRSANRLLELLQRERIAAATEQRDVGSSEIHATLALIEQAKGALMLRYGVDSHQAFAVLRERDPAHAQRRAAPAHGEPAHESPRSA